MAEQILRAILITTLAGSFLTTVITLLKPITRNLFGFSWHYYIWLAVLATMILPIRFTIPSSQTVNIPIGNAQQTHSVQTEETITADNPQVQRNTNTTQKQSAIQNGTAILRQIINNRTNILGAIWLLGMLLMLFINIVGYLRLIGRVRKKSVIISCPEIQNYTKRKITVRTCENLSSPFMMGIFRPSLVLPNIELTPEQLDHLPRHEMTHFKRNDILYKWFATLVKCIHWFNPTVYYAAKQINMECEISCDLSVVSNMSKNEERSYVNTIISLLAANKSKSIPLTTGMTGNKNMLKRRFTMIRNKKIPSKMMSVLSAFIAVVMLSTTVFASGVLFDLSTNEYRIEITNNQEVVNLVNKPFIENGEVYVPLREMLEKTGIMDNEESAITWDSGKIKITIASTAISRWVVDKEEKTDQDGQIVNYLFYYNFEIGKDELNLKLTAETEAITETMQNAPMLKNSLTYIPLSYLQSMIANSGLARTVHYNIYDKDNILLDASGYYTYPVIYEDMTFSIKLPYSWENKYTVQSNSDVVNFLHKATYEKYGEGTGLLFYIEKNTNGLDDNIGGQVLIAEHAGYKFVFGTPTDVQYPVWADRDKEDVAIAAEYEKMAKDMDFIENSFEIKGSFPSETVNKFFEAFSQSDFENMKQYCTTEFIDNFFGAGYVFGMEQAKATRITVPLGANNEPDVRKFAVYVNMKPAPDSVYSPDETTTNFNVYLVKQPDGRYLINEFGR